MLPTTVPDLRGLTANIVTAYVGGNNMSADEIPSLIHSVHAALAGTILAASASPVELVPAVPIKKSVYPNYIVCLEDGMKLTMMKRHLQTSFNLTPHAYRTKWGLPNDYPMVAPDYARRRSAMAKKMGLGRKASKPPTAGVQRRVPFGRARQAPA